jgi:hypothetical protein
VTVRGWNPATKQTVLGQSAIGDPAFPQTLVFEPIEDSASNAARSAGDRYQRAQVEASERQGTSNSPAVRAGSKLTV